MISDYQNNFHPFDIKENKLINYKIGNRTFNFRNSYVMGILNVTPDSFSDGGKFFDKDSAVNHAVKMINDGADIIDIGGESTRPGSENISIDEEIKRVIPVIEDILTQKPETIISIDTTKSEVAEEAVNAGALIINDISGLTFDPKILDVAVKHNSSLIIMHIKGTPKNMQQNPYYDDLIKEINDFLYNQSELAQNSGIQNIFVDPGIGFGKTTEHNFQLLKNLNEFTNLGYPIVIGVSRKSFIGKTLNLEKEERDFPTSVVEAAAIQNGARIIRTHNVKYGSQVCKLLNRIINS